jgi:hypothetical protein
MLSGQPVFLNRPGLDLQQVSQDRDFIACPENRQLDLVRTFNNYRKKKKTALRAVLLVSGQQSVVEGRPE